MPWSPKRCVDGSARAPQASGDLVQPAPLEPRNRVSIRYALAPSGLRPAADRVELGESAKRQLEQLGYLEEQP